MQRRVRIEVAGIVQGVGFRPFVANLARRCALSGWTYNSGRGVTIEVEGEGAGVATFLDSLCNEAPPLSRIEDCTVTDCEPQGGGGFDIRKSDVDGPKTTGVAPDAHLCSDCLRELFDPRDRRYRYPFINCTNCGPRFSLVTEIPYDRPNTTMHDFVMCDACRREYDDPASRRYHAQPIACPDCGPRLSFLGRDGSVVAGDPLTLAIARLRAGEVIAVKGIGGYHLAVDAENQAAVTRLRRCKERDEKPFALMVESLETARCLVRFNAVEARFLSGVERPIVLLDQKPRHGLAPGVAPGSTIFGIMLPYTPLHHLLLREGGFTALVMTSGNRSDEPIAFEDADALQRLEGVADGFLLHNRRIHLRIDDSITRVMAGRPLVLRRGRGYVPRPLMLATAQPATLALGAELKNTFCLTRGDQAFLSQHLGDLGNVESCEAEAEMVSYFQKILAIKPEFVAHDMHPDYYTTRYAETFGGMARVAVQHHHAHLVSCLVENRHAGPALGLIFDGIGYGTDGRVWGGEFLLGDAKGFERIGHFDWMAMPGGDAATRDPWRMALSLLIKAYGSDYPHLPSLTSVPDHDRRLVETMIARGINTPLTSSCGRLFDGVAGLLGLRQRVSYEGQAALDLEMLATAAIAEPPYPVTLSEAEGRMVFDPSVLIRGVVDDMLRREETSRISARFHRSLADVCLLVADKVARDRGIKTVVLSGGVFQNRLLTGLVVNQLTHRGLLVLTHALVPPNDGGISLGQAVVAGQAAVA